jgi:hypothetical protein
MYLLGNSLASLSITSLRLLVVSSACFSSSHLVAVSVRLKLNLSLASLSIFFLAILFFRINSAYNKIQAKMRQKANVAQFQDGTKT